MKPRSVDRGNVKPSSSELDLRHLVFICHASLSDRRINLGILTDQVGIHHAAHDGARPDDSHLHDDIVKRSGLARGKDAWCARLSTWNMPIVSAR